MEWMEGLLLLPRVLGVFELLQGEDEPVRGCQGQCV